MLLYVAVAAAVALWLLVRKPKKTVPGYDIKNQSTIVRGPERIRRNACPLPSKGVENGLVHFLFEDTRTLFEVFQRGRRLSGDGKCMGWREGKGPYQWMSYNEVHERFTSLGSGLQELGLAPGQRTFVGIYSRNCPEWVLTEQACNAYNMVTVPLYDTLGADAVQFIVNQAKISCVVADPPKMKILEECVPKCKSLRLIVKMGAVTAEEVDTFRHLGVTVESLQDVEKRGARSRREHVPPRPEDLATICYTSGTTGDPKGAMLSHANIVADYSAVQWLLQLCNLPPVNTEDTHISYLPLAHMFERVVQALMWCNGARVGFFRGDVKELAEDIIELKPTVFPSVPRLLNRIYDRITGQVEGSGPVKRFLFNLALRMKEQELRAGIIRNNSIWDLLVFRKIQARLGGHVRLMITGAAPIQDRVLRFFRCSMGCPVLEGYGQTETSAGSNLTSVGDPEDGIVGPPLPCNEIKLASVPEMEYDAKDDVGEVCFRGPNIMSGYFESVEKTREAIDQDGWLHSGDIGRWTSSRCLKIIDRKKSIFKLAQGEYVAPEKVENIYIRCPAVQQVFIYGDSHRAALVAIVIPDEECFVRWCKENVGESGSIEDLCRKEKVTQAVMKDMVERGKESKLHGFEQVKAIKLVHEPFTVENGLLTPTFKLKRPELKKRFQADIAFLYEHYNLD